MSDPIEIGATPIRELAGSAVAIVVSDPWEFVSEVGKDTFAGFIRRVGPPNEKNGGVLLIELADSILFRGVKHEFLVAKPRYAGQFLDRVAAGEQVAYGITGISRDKAKSDEALDLTAWRGGLGLIATIQLET